MASKQVRAPCKKCNETWMGDIETAAKRIATPLILGQITIITPQDQIDLWTWATLKTIIGERDNNHGITVRAETRQQFHKTKRPPDDWKIWPGYGCYQGTEWTKRYRHYPLSVAWGGDPTLMFLDLADRISTAFAAFASRIPDTTAGLPYAHGSKLPP